MPNTYLFYDLETSGLNKCFDQVLQFAAIRTDLDLRELERYEVFIKLNPDVIPSPTAVLVHELSMEKMQQGICEYEGMLKIHRLFNTPGTITLGYNTLGFDDEFLRFSFYRNLLTPYTHQYANNCARMDLYPLAIMYYLFKPEGIVWPKINDEITFKLEYLSSHNELTNGNAHNAMSDVEATLALAKLLKKEQTMWEYLCGYFAKKIDTERVEKLSLIADQYPQALLIDGSVGGAKFFQAPVIGLGIHHHYKNQSLWLPLENKPATTTFVDRKRFGEPPILLPLTERFCRYLSRERQELIAKNISWLESNLEAFKGVVEFHREYKYPEIPNLDVDAALYQLGFISDWERLQCNSFHTKSVLEKISVLGDLSANLRTQGLRILGRNYPQVLAKHPQSYSEYFQYLKRIKNGERMVDYKNGLRLAPEAALIEIENLRQTRDLSVKQRGLLTELVKYIQSW